MAKKREFNQGHSFAERATKNMNLKDLKRACIARGMPFEELVGSSVLGLHSWFGNNFDRGQNLQLLNDFDVWMDSELRRNPEYSEPNHPIFHESLKLGFVGTTDDEGNTVTKKKPRLKGLKKPEKKKRERIEGTKIYTGTKKALTYKGAMKGISLERVLAKVKKVFGEDVNEKSVAIWYRRALNEVKKK